MTTGFHLVPVPSTDSLMTKAESCKARGEKPPPPRPCMAVKASVPGTVQPSVGKTPLTRDDFLHSAHAQTRGRAGGFTPETRAENPAVSGAHPPPAGSPGKPPLRPSRALLREHGQSGFHA